MYIQPFEGSRNFASFELSILDLEVMDRTGKQLPIKHKGAAGEINKLFSLSLKWL